jgi:hypothetical protein
LAERSRIFFPQITPTRVCQKSELEIPDKSFRVNIIVFEKVEENEKTGFRLYIYIYIGDNPRFRILQFIGEDEMIILMKERMIWVVWIVFQKFILTFFLENLWGVG